MSVKIPSLRTQVLNLAAVFIGACNAVRHLCIGEMEISIGDPLMGGIILYANCFILSCVLLPVVHVVATRQEPREKPRLWMCLGGIFGGSANALLILASQQLFDIVVIQSLALNTGLLVGASLTDQFGPLGSPKHPITMRALLGMLSFFVGLLFFSVENDVLNLRPFAFFALAAGLLHTVQTVFNRRAASTLRYLPQAQLPNYFCGMAFLILVWLIQFGVQGWKTWNVVLQYRVVFAASLLGYIVNLGFFTIGPKMGQQMFCMIVIFTDTLTAGIMTTVGVRNVPPRRLTLWIVSGFIATFVGTVLSARRNGSETKTSIDALKDPIEELESHETVPKLEESSSGSTCSPTSTQSKIFQALVR